MTIEDRPTEPPRSAAPADSAAPTDPAALAWSVGAEDAFVLVQAAPGRLAHRGGCGRGDDWSGNIDLLLEDEPVVADALAGGTVERISEPSARRIAGPYYATSAAVVPVSERGVVVLGNRTAGGGPGGGPAEAGDDLLRQVAQQVAQLAHSATPAKILADELEVLYAVQAVARSLDLPFGAALEHLVTVAAKSLSCQLVVAVTGRGELAIAENGWRFEGDRRRLTETLIETFSREDRPLRVQDALERPLPDPVSPADGVRAYLALPISPPVGGVLVAIHTSLDPRGFTSLCQRISEQLVDAGSVLLQVAALRHELLEQVKQSSKEARLDVLTGVANRLAWDEAIAEAQRQAHEGKAMTIMVADLDDLKGANDQHGHTAGDHLIAALASALNSSVRVDHDLVARLGGDEFGVLLPGMAEDVAARKIDRVRAQLDAVRSSDDLPVRASLGVATCTPHGSVEDTWLLADERMYAQKRNRQSRSPHRARPAPPDGRVVHAAVAESAPEH